MPRPVALVLFVVHSRLSPWIRRIACRRHHRKSRPSVPPAPLSTSSRSTPTAPRSPTCSHPRSKSESPIASETVRSLRRVAAAAGAGGRWCAGAGPAALRHQRRRRGRPTFLARHRSGVLRRRTRTALQERDRRAAGRAHAGRSRDGRRAPVRRRGRAVHVGHRAHQAGGGPRRGPGRHAPKPDPTSPAARGDSSNRSKGCCRAAASPGLAADVDSLHGRSGRAAARRADGHRCRACANCSSISSATSGPQPARRARTSTSCSRPMSGSARRCRGRRPAASATSAPTTRSKASSTSPARPEGPACRSTRPARSRCCGSRGKARPTTSRSSSRCKDEVFGRSRRLGVRVARRGVTVRARPEITLHRHRAARPRRVSPSAISSAPRKQHRISACGSAASRYAIRTASCASASWSSRSDASVTLASAGAILIDAHRAASSRTGTPGTRPSARSSAR